MPENTKNDSGCKKEIHFEIPAAEVMKEWGRVVDQFASRAKIKGFRPGKAPKDMINRMYYQDIRETVINNLVPPALNKKLAEEKIVPAGQPVISDLHFHENEPIRFNVTVETWPEIHLPDYKGMKVSNKKVSVEEKEIDEALQDLQAKSAQYIPTEGRGVRDGDYIVAEVKGKNTQTNKSLVTEKVVILAGHKDNEEALNKNLLGLQQGEKTRFSVQYKDDHENKKLAGQEIAYELKVESVKEKKLPEINDDFAKDLGDYENLLDLKTKLREQLLVSKKQAKRREMAEEMIEKISDQMSLELPESVIERESNALLEQRLSSLPHQNLSEEALDSLQEEVQKRAAQNIRNQLILTKIAEQEKLQVSEEEIKEEMKAIATKHNVPLARVVESINREGQKEELKDNLLIRKTVDFLLESAIME